MGFISPSGPLSGSPGMMASQYHHQPGWLTTKENSPAWFVLAASSSCQGVGTLFLDVYAPHAHRDIDLRLAGSRARPEKMAGA